MREEVTKIIQAELFQKNLNRDLLLKIIDKIEEIEKTKGWDLADFLPKIDVKTNKIVHLVDDLQKITERAIKEIECQTNKKRE